MVDNNKIVSKSDFSLDQTVNPYVSVDCVLLGFDGERLNVLIVGQREKENDNNSTGCYKLPGSLIYMNETLDEAAQRVLFQLTGLVKVKMVQFHAFSDISRLSDPKDTVWLERFHRLERHLERVITIGYISLLRIDRRYKNLITGYEARWVPIDELPHLAFDHNQIVDEAQEAVRRIVRENPEHLFSLLPRKFTAAQLHAVYQAVTGYRIDVRNFHKKIQTMPYVVPLDEKEQGVNHRAGRFFKFERKK